MAKLFISYSRVDILFKDEFVNWLQKTFRSHSVWHDFKLDGGDIWWNEIIDQVGACDIFIYLLSNESVQSKYCQAEFKEAQRLQKQIIPIQVRDRTKLQGDLSDIQYVDMKNGVNDQDAVSRFIRALEKQIDRIPDVPLEPLSPQRTLKPTDVVELERPSNAEAIDTPPLVIETAKQTAIFVHSVSILGVLPPPFEWISIPAGKVNLNVAIPGFFAQETPYNVSDFFISKYPITNAQYAKFVEAQGYDEIRWWQNGSWEIKENEKWKMPRYWMDMNWNTTDHPVVGISLFEALAFCEWLKDVSGEIIYLPNEQQWQRAAQGDTDLTYPWGDEWDSERCNNSVTPNKSVRTTPVQQYEGLGKGNSPYGVVDLSGNVWEWCNSLLDLEESEEDETGGFIMRGGSWKSDQFVVFNLAYRYGKRPTVRNNLIGFRIARMP